MKELKQLNRNKHELREAMLNRYSGSMVVYSRRVVDDILPRCPSLVTQVIPAIYWEIRRSVKQYYNVSIVMCAEIRYGRVRAQFFPSTEHAHVWQRRTVSDLAMLRWPKNNQAGRRREFIKDQMNRETDVEHYLEYSYGVFNGVVKPLFIDCLNEAFELLGQGYIVDEVIDRLFPERKNRKIKALEVESARAQRNQIEKARKANAREKKSHRDELAAVSVPSS